MILIGAILLILGLIAAIPLLFDLGVILLVIGLVLLLFGLGGRAVGGRRYWYWTVFPVRCYGRP